MTEVKFEANDVNDVIWLLLPLVYISLFAIIYLFTLIPPPHSEYVDELMRDYPVLNILGLLAILVGQWVACVFVYSLLSVIVVEILNKIAPEWCERKKAELILITENNEEIMKRNNEAIDKKLEELNKKK